MTLLLYYAQQIKTWITDKTEETFHIHHRVAIFLMTALLHSMCKKYSLLGEAIKTLPEINTIETK